MAALHRGKALASKTPAHHGLVIDEATDLRAFSGLTQLVGLSNLGAIPAIAWTPVAMEPTGARRPRFGHHTPPAGYGVIRDDRLRRIMNLGPVPTGYQDPDLSAAWARLFTDYLRIFHFQDYGRKGIFQYLSSRNNYHVSIFVQSIQQKELKTLQIQQSNEKRAPWFFRLYWGFYSPLL